MRILLAEDDPLLGDGLRAGLRQSGFQVDWVRDGVAAERELRAEPYAAAVLDLGLPLKDGMAVLASIRRAAVKTPVLVLTARDAVPIASAGWTWAPTTMSSSRSICTNSPRGCELWCAARMASPRTASLHRMWCSIRLRAPCSAAGSPSRCPRASSTCCMR